MSKNLSQVRSIGILLVCILALSGCIPSASVEQPESSDRTLDINGQRVNVVLADTPTEQAKGLSGVASLDDSEGMLFVFQEDGSKTFWMKGMIMPIDIIWLNNSEVVKVDHSVQPEPGVPEEELQLYSSQGPSDMVLEVRSGFAKAYNINSGDAISFVE